MVKSETKGNFKPDNPPSDRPDKRQRKWENGLSIEMAKTCVDNFRNSATRSLKLINSVGDTGVKLAG